MNVALWISQGLLALTCAVSGSLKSTMSMERMLATGQTGVRGFPLPVIRVVAGAELLAAPGLILPWWTGIAPVLTPLAACSFGVLMIGAALSHGRLREFGSVSVNLLLCALCVFVAAGRF
ncbi:DoxX family protein [Amycolatopsis anabasis]|uniref:DoxX family protein n=1 Tax=Amycolatopsis anabasis TaxID=1840409 RepID=UPI00131C15CA|nr:DoxX family protein [Amycolatopsis anabasis]